MFIGEHPVDKKRKQGLLGGGERNGAGEALRQPRRARSPDRGVIDTAKCRIQCLEPMVSTAARFDLKLDAAEKDLLAKAATLMGTTMAGFVRSAAKEKAQTMLEQESRVTLSKRDFLAFNTAINGAFAPNAALAGPLPCLSTRKTPKRRPSTSTTVSLPARTLP
jgi:uncharacterized protein (DUF1778 family)